MTGTRHGEVLIETKSGVADDRCIGALFLRAREAWSPKRVVLRHKRYGIWNKYTWAEHYQRTRDFALGLTSLGLKRGDKVAVIGDSQPEIYWALHGVWCAGGAIVGVHVDVMPREVQYMVDFADARLVIAKDQEQVDKLLRVKDELPKVERVIWWDPRGMHGYDDPWLSSFEAVSESGRAYAANYPNAFEERIAESRPEDLAGIWYTSGTTGLPKACCHTQRSLLTYVDLSQEVVHGEANDDTVVLFGVGSMGECGFGSLALLVKGVRVNIPEAPETYQQDMREVAPSYVLCLPLQWESIISTIQVNVGEAHFVKRLLYDQFLKVGHKCASLKCAGKQPGLGWRVLHLLGELLMFHPLRDRVGLSRLKIGINTGYTLGEQAFMFLRALGIEVRQLYGSTEQGQIAAHMDGQIRPESVGVLLEGVEMRISPEGELLTRGPCVFAGYHKNAEATEKVLAGGWFHTGDSGYIDERGHVFVFGRLSEMGELATGAKYAPQFIEAQLRFGAHIHDAVAIGSRQRDYVTAVITLDQKAAARWAENRRLDYTTLVDLSQKDEMADLVMRDIQRVNRTVPSEARIRKFVVLHKEFDADEGELTRSRKVKRSVVESRYADMIEAMYTDRSEVIVRAQVTYQDGRTGTVTATVKVRRVPFEE